MAPIARGDDADVLGRRGQAALERGLQLAVARVARVEREVVAEHDEALRRAREHFEHVGQVEQIGAVHLRDAHSALGITLEQAAHRRRLARPALAVQEHVVERQPGQELLGVGDEAALRAVDPDQIVEIEELRPLDRPQAPAAAARVPAERDGPVEDVRGGRQPAPSLERTLGERQHALEPIEDSLPAPHGSLYAASDGDLALGGRVRRSDCPARRVVRPLRPRVRAAQRARQRVLALPPGRRGSGAAALPAAAGARVSCVRAR